MLWFALRGDAVHIVAIGIQHLVRLKNVKIQRFVLFKEIYTVQSVRCPLIWVINGEWSAPFLNCNLYFKISNLYVVSLPIFLFFSFDVRGRAFAKALYWSDTNSFGPRAYFVTVSRPAALSVESIQLDDGGVRTCW